MSVSQRPNSKDDAQMVFQVLKRGGIAILPMNVGYGITATDPDALDRIFHTKQRPSHKRHAMVGSYSLHRDLHVIPPQQADIVKLLTLELNLPLGVVAPYRPDHPIIQNLSPKLLAQSVVDGTMSILVNGGPLLEELSRLATLEALPLMGSSANISGKGAKTVVEDIEPEILGVANIVIDYGRQKFHSPRASSTMIDFRSMEIIRYGACYDVVQDTLWRFYGIKTPDDPGNSRLYSGKV